MNTDERRACKKFESKYSIYLPPDKWDSVKREFSEQRKGKFGTVEEIIDELIAYLTERGIHFEWAEI